MKSILSLLVSMILTAACFSQQETFSLVTYTIPSGWHKDAKQNLVAFSSSDKKKRTWCQIGVYKETASKGSIDADFESEWNEIVKPMGAANPPQTSEAQEFDGWKMKSGFGTFTFNGSNASSSLTVFSGYNVCLSVIGNTNSADYLPAIQDFLSGLKLSRPENTQPVQEIVPANQVQENTPAFKDRFTFNTTNFDDGWVSAVQADWVSVTKGKVKVLLHYPKDGTIFPADPGPMTDAAWNILVAPRYSHLQQYKTSYVNTYNRPYLGMGYLTDNSTQQKVFVVLFHQSAGWIEVVSPDKNTFIQYFNFDPEVIRWDSDPDVLKTLDGMISRNRFAVAASDLNGTGKWDNRFSSNTFYSNYYTGAYAGMSTYSSSQWFVFGNSQTFTWELIAANSMGGVTKAAGAKGGGKFTVVNNWQLSFNKIEGKEKLYDVYFSAIKGGRVLFMNDAKYPGSGIFTGYTRK
ncbi:MAG: hypothetical protein ABW007_28025 [Chitinophagaceae bacterium]